MPSHEGTNLFIALNEVHKGLRSRSLPETAAIFGRPFAPRHFSALLQIKRNEPVGMSELAECMQVSLATASQIVTDLEDLGVVDRRSDPNDKRRTLVCVAPEHRDDISIMIEERLDPLDRTLRRLEPAQRSGLIRGLLALADELHQESGQTAKGRPR